MTQINPVKGADASQSAALLNPILRDATTSFARTEKTDADVTFQTAFNTALGYTKTGQLSAVGHKFGRNLDLVLMQKALVTPSGECT